MADHTIKRDTLQEIALSQITVPEGFNPRGAVVEDDALHELADTLRQRGMLQPVRVRATDTGDYILVAGERRYRAAALAALTVVPAIVRPAGAGDADEQAALLEDALLENDQRKDLDPLARARTYQRLREAGRTIKGIAAALGGPTDAKTQRRLERRVRETLRILQLPDGVQQQVAAGEVPARAVKTLAELGAIHPELAALGVAQVLEAPADAWEPALSWEDLVDDPIAVVADVEDDQLPPGVYDAHGSHPLSRFALTDQAAGELEELCGLLDLSTGSLTVRFDPSALEGAQGLGALHSARRRHAALVVGQDVADQLAGDTIHAMLEREREAAAQRTATSAPSGDQDPARVDPGGSREAASEDEVEAQQELRRRAEREAEQQARRQAVAYNTELGAAVLKRLARVRVDERALRILTAVDLHGELDKIASRGARYAFPGWPQESHTKTGKAKVEYLGATDAGARAREFLAGAKSTGDIAGRAIALLVCAHYAQEACVAQSNRAGYALRPAGYSYEAAGGLPWTDQVLGELEALAEERLPEHLVAHVRDAREARQREDAERAEAHQRAEGADVELREGLEAMSAPQRLEALRAFGEAHGRHGDVAWRLREHIQRLNAADEVGVQPGADHAA